MEEVDVRWQCLRTGSHILDIVHVTKYLKQAFVSVLTTSATFILR
jgi:hypothetical protein